MDQTEENAQQQFIADGTGQMGYTPPPPHDTPDVVATSSNIGVSSSSTMQSLPLPVSRPQHQLNNQQARHLQHVQERLRQFWANQMQEMKPADFKSHSLPINPIKRIMKADKDVRMIARESPALLAKACEMFILDLTSRAWIKTEDDSRRIVQPKDIAKAIYETDIFDFLEGSIPTDKLREQIAKSPNIRQQHCHGVRVSSVSSAGGQELPPFMPLDQPGPQNQQSFMPGLRAQTQTNQQQPSAPWPQAQQMLQQQSPEQASLFWPHPEQTPEEQNPEQPSLSPSSPQAELALDQQQDDN
ncbi:uncharacterized protein LOC141672193 isoform X2 [Apium graveolens]|uniref:uncharacterized protein LOC141672193 isoform X2 n=1 Tax=Apium graveolens TaxID=4045 RepID=UPI003D78F688